LRGGLDIIWTPGEEDGTYIEWKRLGKKASRINIRSNNVILPDAAAELREGISLNWRNFE
jgi:hypothetical protein